MSLPIQGNQYFNRVENVASSQIQRVMADTVVTTNLTVGSSYKFGPLTYTTVVGYTPTTINGGGTSSFTLQSQAGQGQATSSSGLTIPAGAYLINTTVLNTGAIFNSNATTITVGTGALNAAPGVTGLSATTTLSAGTANTNVLWNAGGTGAGAALPTVSATVANNFVNVQVGNTGITTAVSLLVAVTYAQFL